MINDGYLYSEFYLLQFGQWTYQEIQNLSFSSSLVLENVSDWNSENVNLRKQKKHQLSVKYLEYHYEKENLLCTNILEGLIVHSDGFYGLMHIIHLEQILIILTEDVYILIISYLF